MGRFFSSNEKKNSFFLAILINFSYLCSSVTTSLETPLRKGLIINRGHLQRIARPCHTNCTPAPNRWHGRAIHLARTDTPRRGGTFLPTRRHFSPCVPAPLYRPCGTSLRRSAAWSFLEVQPYIYSHLQRIGTLCEVAGTACSTTLNGKRVVLGIRQVTSPQTDLNRTEIIVSMGT